MGTLEGTVTISGKLREAAEELVFSLVSKAIEERHLVTKEEVLSIISGAPKVEEAPRKRNRGPRKTKEELRALNAEYQRRYRAKVRAQRDAEKKPEPPPPPPPVKPAKPIISQVPEVSLNISPDL